ncbi:uncharacterized protein EURHEDRAFT_540926 [Aspergillus ruber CBS 135680]|uniref:Uncharacterized protein n=1 Tax=Aspergillus ruber (strain CBS 135680) TaxID=1388766 RepID=A0A017SRF1_ASPRC|nr:uncharacterized protein EURHEDRAFT_540926 [Aspergillus ruber CBS 135680]EYE99154.1 hypothetical protein EURHEDRAFT_540926 [Aspergillus ruber CBS 135680]
MTPRLLKNSFWPADEPIQRIPPSLNVVYEKIIDRVSSEQVHTVRKLIQDHCCSTASLNNTKKKKKKRIWHWALLSTLNHELQHKLNKSSCLRRENTTAMWSVCLHQ